MGVPDDGGRRARDRCHSRFADRGGTSDCNTLKLPGAAPLVEESGGEEGMYMRIGTCLSCVGGFKSCELTFEKEA